jgi:cell pole-organizing protein PopZ
MTDTNAQEPTMEEILASIRRIISEDDAPPADATVTPPGAVEAAAEEEEDDDVLELTEPVAPPEPEPEDTIGDLDVFPVSAADHAPEPPPPPPAPKPAPPPPRAAAPPPAPPPPAPAPAPVEDDEPLVSGRAAEAAASHFGQLAQSIAMPKEGRTLEDLVRELLRPMLKQWLDQHLADIVEARVRAEVERLSRGR